MAALMSPDALQKALSEDLLGWEMAEGGNAIEKDFKFRDFPSAMQFMNAVAEDAEKMDHHPDWSNSYNQVHIQLSTHAAGGVTKRDIALASAIEARSADYP